ncbi:MAG: hypothetical protein JXB10_12595 [Pirellulales bacterium]|nr:hypothetical protein [Pirellulales bacterium]
MDGISSPHAGRKPENIVAQNNIHAPGMFFLEGGSAARPERQIIGITSG